jgi:hypothetical protein
MEEKRTYEYFTEDVVTAYIANYSVYVLNEVCEGRLISHRLWLTRSPDLIPCDLYLW